MYSQIKSATFALIALIFGVSTTAFSQESRFSISINSLTTNFNYGGKNHTLQPYKKDYKGLQAGISYQAGISPIFSVVPELYFAIKGATLKQNNPLTINKATLRIYSIEMPVLARLHINQFYINAGPYVGYSVGGRLKIDGSTEIPASSTKVSFGTSPGDFKRWDYGAQAGVGYNFRLKRTYLTLDARYGYGMANISQDAKRYNRMLNLSLVVSKRAKKEKI